MFSIRSLCFAFNSLTIKDENSMSDQPRTKPRLQHISLPVRIGEQEITRAFYANLLGLQEKPAPPDLAQRGIIWFAAGDNEMELHFLPDTYLPHPEEGRHFCLEVENLESYRQRLSDAGYRIVEASAIPGRPRFFTVDPYGNRVELTTIEGDYQQAQ
jgi:catechol 2,3-dioxygenase-like lactoylglutathione lyase family enzyme